MRIIICDRCSKKIEANTMYNVLNVNGITYDLCRDCVPQVEDLMKQALAPIPPVPSVP